MPAESLADDDQFAAAAAFAEQVGNRVADFNSALGDTDRALLWEAFCQRFWPIIGQVGDPDHLRRGLAIGWVCGLLEDEHGWTAPGATHVVVHNGICLACREEFPFSVEGPGDVFAVEVGYWCSRTRLRPGSQRAPAPHPVLAAREPAPTAELRTLPPSPTP
jgi:hypothetical protein